MLCIDTDLLLRGRALRVRTAASLAAVRSRGLRLRFRLRPVVVAAATPHVALHVQRVRGDVGARCIASDSFRDVVQLQGTGERGGAARGDRELHVPNEHVELVDARPEGLDELQRVPRVTHIEFARLLELGARFHRRDRTEEERVGERPVFADELRRRRVGRSERRNQALCGEKCLAQLCGHLLVVSDRRRGAIIRRRGLLCCGHAFGHTFLLSSLCRSRATRASEPCEGTREASPAASELSRIRRAVFE